MFRHTHQLYTYKSYEAIIIALISASLLSGCNFLKQSSEQINHDNDKTSLVISDAPDNRIIKAFIDNDEKTIDTILNSNEHGEIIDLLKSYEPVLKIRSFRDINKASCIPSTSCKKNYTLTDSELDDCAESKMSSIKFEIENNPQCTNAIREFHLVTNLCMLKNYQDLCFEEDLDNYKSDPQKRNRDLIHNGQNTYQCMSKFLKDINARTACIVNTPKHTKEELNAKTALYCEKAVNCHVFSDIKPCINKYNDLFKKDKTQNIDCTNIHLTSMIDEFNYLDFILTQEENVQHNICPYIEDYEKTVHPETLLIESKSIYEYTQKTMIESQKPINENMVSWYRIGNYLSAEAKKKTDPSQYMQLQSQNRYSINYYISCRTPQLGHDD